MSLTELAHLLGLSDDATEEQIRAKLKELTDAPSQLRAEIEWLEANAPVAAKSILDELGLPESATEAEVRGKLIALKRPEGHVSREEFDALEQQLAEREAADLVHSAIAACKVTPAQRDWAMAYARRDPKGFAAFIESAPALIDAKATRPAGAGGSFALTDDERLVCEQLGLEPAQFAAAG